MFDGDDGDAPHHWDYGRLKAAVRGNRLEAVLDYLSHDIDPNVYVGTRLPIHLAVGKPNSIEVVDALVGAGARVNALSRERNVGVAPIAIAITHQRLENVEYLLEHGVHPNAPASEAGRRPLHFALDAESYFPAAARLLLDKGASPNETDRSGRTPLHVVASAGEAPWAPEAMRLLLSRGGDPNAVTRERRGSSVLHLAVEAADVAIVQVLIQHKKTNLNATNRRGATPLILAVNLYLEASEISSRTKLRKMIRALCKAGADVNARGQAGEASMLAKVVGQLRVHRDADLVRLLLGCGARVKSEEPAGRSPVHSVLLIYNDPPPPDGGGLTRKHLLDLLRALMGAAGGAAAASATFQSKGLSVPFVWVPLFAGHLAPVRILVDEGGVDPNTVLPCLDCLCHRSVLLSTSRTAHRLVHASIVLCCDREIQGLSSDRFGTLAEYFIKHPSVDLTANNSAGQTPLEVARQTNQPKLVKVIEKKMRSRGQLR